MHPFQEGPWSPGTFCSSTLYSSSFIFPHFLLTKQLGLYTAAVHCLCLCGHQGLSAFTALSPQGCLLCYNSVILDSILGEYLLKHSKDLFTRHGLYYSEVPILVLVAFSPLGQRLCLPILL